MPEKRRTSIIDFVRKVWKKRNRIKSRLEEKFLFSYFDSNLGYPYNSYEALNCLINNYSFDSVLDVGCGEGIHSDVFLKAGKKVTANSRRTCQLMERRTTSLQAGTCRC